MRYTSLFFCGFFLCACESIAHDLIDDDGDGYLAVYDCDDTDPAIHPTAAELCGDSVDSDCDGFANGGTVEGGVLLYPDDDDDGHGAGTVQRAFCAAEPRWSPVNDDCDDGDDTRSPGGVELCNDSVDNDCDTLVDTLDPNVEYAGGPWFVDGDNDGHGAAPYYGCEASAITTTNDDCDDADMGVHPGGGEYCDGIDNDCDDQVDAADPDLVLTSAYYFDADHDGYGDPDTQVGACAPPTADHVAQGRDCDDDAMAINPGMQEACGNGVDDDCDQQVDGVRFVPKTSVLWPEVDFTTLFASGTALSPANIDVPHAGRIEVCPGTYYVRLRPTLNMEVVGLGAASETILDGAGATVVVAPGTLNTKLVSLTVRGGVASQSVTRPDSAFSTLYTAGGGLFCSRPSESFLAAITLENVIFESNRADLGAAIFVDRCGVQATNLEVRNNDAEYDGGGLYIARSSSTTLGPGTSIHDNYAQSAGGGIYAFSGAGTWTSIDVRGNYAGDFGGGVAASKATISIASSSFDENSGSTPQVRLTGTPTSVLFSACTFGTAPGSDIHFASPVNQHYSYGTDATTVTCSTTTSSCQ